MNGILKVEIINGENKKEDCKAFSYWAKDYEVFDFGQ